MYAQTISNTILSNLGHSISIKYLPSQVAALSLSIAWKAVLNTETHPLFRYNKRSTNTINKLNFLMQESMKILGHKTDASSGIGQLKQEVMAHKEIREYLQGLGYVVLRSEGATATSVMAIATSDKVESLK